MISSISVPAVMVVLGATGDLMRKKIVPALFNLYQAGRLPRLFHIVGVSRRDWNDDQFRELLSQILIDHGASNYDQFLTLWSYHRGGFETLADYRRLAEKLGFFDRQWRVCANKLFYIAAPPEHYAAILNHLHQSHLTDPCSPGEGFTRILIEKPFGKDQATADRLEKTLSSRFQEEQIYRIDHYLAKETLQNILNFRFSNTLFEGVWSNQFIEKVRIRLWEKIGVEKRGIFYDGIGALRDVGQNHLLQMLALVTMDHPGSFTTEAIRAKRLELLQTLILPKADEIKRQSYRAQYRGYNQIKGVNKNSTSETYFKITAGLSHPRWRGVPFILESGKRLAEVRKEIIVTFKHPQPCFCPPGTNHQLTNRVVFQLEPKEGVFVDLWSKKPGLHPGMKGQKFKFLIRPKQNRTQYVEEYEKLILDSILGNQTLFISSQEVVAMWRFIDPIATAWKKNAVPLARYEPDSEKPLRESQFIDEGLISFGEIGLIGLGKMGGNIALRLLEKGWSVAGYNRSPEDTKSFAAKGLLPAFSLKELVDRLTPPRLIWLSLPAGKAIDETLFGKGGIVSLLSAGDVVIDGGNSFYQDSIRRAKQLEKHKINFIDVGISGGPDGARNGASLMIGGRREIFERYEALFAAESQPLGYQFFPGAGAGHFVKMVHNGIEYGMMQAIAEGFSLLKSAPYHLDLSQVADIYNHGSVIESRLIGWLEEAFRLYGDELHPVSGSVAHTGEGQWTVDTAKQLGVVTKIIAESLLFRLKSVKKPSYTGKILSALRGQFGGHIVAGHGLEP